MGKDTKNPVVIDGVEYLFEDMTDEQKLLVNHCLDLTRKIDNAQFSIQQLQVGKDSFVKLLKEALEKQPAEAVESVQ